MSVYTAMLARALFASGVTATAAIGFQATADAHVGDIGDITVCPGLPIPPISREHGVRLKGLA